MPSGGLKVKFRDDALRGAARDSQRRSDSGVGSSSDTSFRATYPDRYAEQNQLYDVQALQEAFNATVLELDNWKKKVRQVDGQLVSTRKELHKVNAQWRGQAERIQLIEDDNKKLVKENKILANDNTVLTQHITAMEKKVTELENTLVAYQAQTSTAPLESNKSRSTGRRKVKDEAEKEKDRLSRRFDRDSDSSNGPSSKRSTSKAPGTRVRCMSPVGHGSKRPYIEPFGQGASRPNMNLPQSPIVGRQVNGYVSTSRTTQPTITQTYDPVYTSVPLNYTHEPELSYEDGNYYPHPLPKKTR